jgi:hypothetical protein
MMKTATTTATTSTPTSPGTRRRNRGLTVLGGMAAAAAVWLVAVPLAGVDLLARTGPGGAPAPVTLVAVLVAGLVVGLAGWALLAILEKTVRRAGVAWRSTAAVVLLLSLLGPLAQGAGATAIGVLATLHVVVGLVLIALLPGRAAAAARP